jgi:hypothetical protein
MPLTKIPAALVGDDVATQAELDAEAAARALKLTGDVVQVVHTQTGALATGSTTIPWDDTIPQITEGDEYMTRTITPAHASNRLVIEVNALLNASNVNYLIGALFKDADANALAAMAVYQEGSSRPQPLNFTHEMAAGTTSPITFRFRAGTSGASTLTFNGEAGVRRLGGAMASSITITEIKA